MKGSLIVPVVANFVFHFVVVEFNAKAGSFGQFDVAVFELERFFEVVFAKHGVFLREEVGDAGVELDTGS